MSLELLDLRVRELVEKRGFSSLSDVQEQSIPPILKGSNVLVIAPTGTGKTESAMLPVFSDLSTAPGTGFRALYITPLRSLNRDILGRLTWWCSELGISVGVRHGDTTAAERRKQALNPPELLITTPETLQALFMGKRLRKHLANVRYVIIDEVHELAGSKRGAQLSIALERLAEYSGDFQRIALSATVGNPDEVGQFFCGTRPFELVSIPVAPHLDITVQYGGEEFSDQVDAIGSLIDQSPSTLIFVNTRVTAEALGHGLYDRGDIDVHHGSLSREVRIDAEERFRKHDIRALICTSSMELGIDIGHIGHVIQSGSPREVARLVQRIGRAGHSLDTTSCGTIVTTGFDDHLEALVITRRAKAGEVEDVCIEAKAADVLANQIAALALEYGEITFPRAGAIIGRSYCFRESGDLIRRVAEQMALHRLIRIEDDIITRTGRTRLYLTSNLSMIHDERKVAVFDMISRRTVASLDDSFVAAWLNTGMTFITKGQIWCVLDMEDGRIIVEPARHARGELPSWEGEQIPVPFAVAREAGCLRRTRDFAPYAGGAGSSAMVGSFLDRLDNEGYPVPTDRHISVENADGGVVVNICAGHRVNETLARVLSILVSARYGSSVGIEVGAYRFFLRLPGSVRADEIAEMLGELDPDHIKGILHLALKRTSLYKWKLVQVAKKFGAIDSDAEYEKISIHRLADLFDDTVVQEEAYRELLTRYMDINGTEAIVHSIRSGDISISTGRLGLLGKEGLFGSRDLIAPPTIDQAVIGNLKRRLEKDSIILFCMNCRKWKLKTNVERVTEHPQCPLCGARLIAALKPFDEELIGQVKKRRKELTDEERTAEIRLLRNANLVLSSGKKAVTALAARGVGPDNASRILAKMRNGDAFYREILQAERNYIRTHRFW